MIRLLAVGLWAGAVATGSGHATGLWMARHATAAAPHDGEHAPALEHRKTRSINVPVIAGGAVQGYLVAQFGYTLDAKVAETLAVPPDAFLLDEAFRTFYAEDRLDFRKVSKVDLSRVAREIAGRVNARMGGEILKEVLVQDFTYVGREDVRR